MKILIDFFPILLFFGAYKLHGIYAATAVLMVATVVQMGLIYAIDRKLQTIHKITLLLVLGFGALTLGLQDERFIKWKPTVLYGAMASGLAFALWVFHKNFLKLLLGSQIELPERIWHHLNIAWVGYCAFMAAINAFVVVQFNTDTWVNFKLWGYVFPLAFIIAQGFYIAPHLKNQTAEPHDSPPTPKL
jgi:intracellular septation protein